MVCERAILYPTDVVCPAAGLSWDEFKMMGDQIADLNLHIEGVLVAKKDFNLPKHGDIDTKNLYVRCYLLSILQLKLKQGTNMNLSI